MTDARQVVGVSVLMVALLFGARGAAERMSTQAGGPGIIEITAAQRAAPIHFHASVSPGYQQAVNTAIRSARPEAQRLIAIVDGVTEIFVGATRIGALGLTEAGPDIDGFRVTLDLDGVFEHGGTRGINRLVLHEFGHVIDHALLSDPVRHTLDGAIPAGVGCDEGQMGGCAIREERFAETFAKWAVNDVGHNLYIGYKVPPPPSLDAWGVPLASVQ